MRTGYLDPGSGKWVDTAPADSFNDERTVEVGGDGLVRPSGAPPKAGEIPMQKVDVGSDGLVRPSKTQVAPAAPMSTVEKAKMIKERRAQTNTSGSR